MASEEDKGVMRALLLRMRQVDYRPNAEERLVLAGCENRALRYGLSAGAVSALGTAVALRRFAGTGLLGTIFRTTSVAMAGTTAAVAASQYTSGACLCDLLAISATSPLGGEAARLLSDSNPTSKHLQALPNKARWAPETLPRLPMPAHTRESLHTSVAARPAQAAAPQLGYCSRGAPAAAHGARRQQRLHVTREPAQQEHRADLGRVAQRRLRATRSARGLVIAWRVVLLQRAPRIAPYAARIARGNGLDSTRLELEVWGRRRRRAWAEVRELTTTARAAPPPLD